MNNLEYRKSRGTSEPCTAIRLPTGNIVKRNRVIEAFELIFVDDSICPHCGFTDDKRTCTNCCKEKY